MLALNTHTTRYVNITCNKGKRFNKLIPERWTYERRYTKVRHMTAAIKAAIITFANHSGVLPGFLHENTMQAKQSLPKCLANEE